MFEETRVSQGIFGFSFLSWQGNQVSFEESSWLKYILLSLTFIGLISFIIFRKYLTINYNNHKKRILTFLQFYSTFIIFLTIFRIIILAIGNYPNTWELIPFHFCRMFVILMSFFLIFKKIDWIKYIGFFAICGAIVGLLITDLNTSSYWDERGGIKVGYDSYAFWDFYIVHISSVFIGQYIIMVNKFQISKWDVLITSISLISLSLTLFIIDWGLSFNSNPSWQANWFYFGPDEINGIVDVLTKFLGPIAKWPSIFFLFVFIGIFLYWLSLSTYFLIDQYEIDFKRFPIIKKVKSSSLECFRNSRWSII